MLDNYTQSILSDLMFQCIQGEKRIELSRISLSEKYDFSPQNFFSLITSSASISSRDLKAFLSKNQGTTKDSELFMMIKQYSCLQDGRISLEDFYQIFLPSTNEALRQRTLNRPMIKSFSDSTLKSFLKVLQEEIKLQEDLEGLKELLYKQRDFSVYNAFEIIVRGKQIIDERDLIDFLRKNKMFITEDDVDALFRRVDVEDDGVISYNEFLEFIIPFNLPAKNTSPEADTLELSAKNIEIAEKDITTSKEEEKKNEDFASKDETKIERKENINDRLLDLFLAARYEEYKKQELTIFTDFSIAGALATITQVDKLPANSKALSLFLTIPETDAMLLLKNNEFLTEEILSSLLLPYNPYYKTKKSPTNSNPLSSLSESFLKDVLISIISTEKLLFSIKKYQESSLAATRNESLIDLSSSLISKYLDELGINLIRNDLDLLINRLGIIN